MSLKMQLQASNIRAYICFVNIGLYQVELKDMKTRVMQIEHHLNSMVAYGVRVLKPVVWKTHIIAYVESKAPNLQWLIGTCIKQLRYPKCWIGVLIADKHLLENDLENDLNTKYASFLNTDVTRFYEALQQIREAMGTDRSQDHSLSMELLSADSNGSPAESINAAAADLNIGCWADEIEAEERRRDARRFQEVDRENTVDGDEHGEQCAILYALVKKSIQQKKELIGLVHEKLSKLMEERERLHRWCASVMDQR